MHVLRAKRFFVIWLISAAVYSQRGSNLPYRQPPVDMKSSEITALKNGIIRNRKDQPDSVLIKADAVYQLALKSDDKSEIVAAAKDLAQSFQRNIKPQNNNQMFENAVHYMNLAIKI